MKLTGWCVEAKLFMKRNKLL